MLGTPVHALGERAAVERIIAWATDGTPRYVALCNAHVLVTAERDPDYREALRAADLRLPDGAPVAWVLRRRGFSGQRRLPGPDLTWALCERCAQDGVAVYFYGGEASTLRALRGRLEAAFPRLVAHFEAPPFAPEWARETPQATRRMTEARVGVVFVGLGCPRQELWMAANSPAVGAVMLGVGAAFDFHAGTRARAPGFMRRLGLEWLHRLMSEPARLWRRYLVTNTLFALGALAEALGLRARDGRR